MILKFDSSRRHPSDWLSAASAVALVLVLLLVGCSDGGRDERPEIMAKDRAGLPVPQLDIYLGDFLIGSTGPTGVLDVSIGKAKEMEGILDNGSGSERLKGVNSTYVGFSPLVTSFGATSVEIVVRKQRTVDVHVSLMRDIEQSDVGAEVPVYAHVAARNAISPSFESRRRLIATSNVGKSDPQGNCQFKVGCDDDEQVFVWADSRTYWTVEASPSVIYEAFQTAADVECRLDHVGSVTLVATAGSAELLGGAVVESPAILFDRARSGTRSKLRVRCPVGTAFRVMLPTLSGQDEWRLDGDDTSIRFVDAVFQSAGDDLELRIGFHESLVQAETTIVAPLSVAQSYFRLTTEPVPADVFVDGTNIGTTPLSFKVAAGTHRLELRPENAQYSRVFRNGYSFPENTSATRRAENFILPHGPAPTVNNISRLRTEGRFEEAVALGLSAPWRADPAGQDGYRDAHRLVAQILAKDQNDRAQAIDVLERSLQHLENEPLLNLELGVLQSEVQLFGQAEQHLRRAKQNARVYTGDIVTYIINRANFFLAKVFDGRREGADESEAVILCQTARFHYQEFDNNVSPSDQSLGYLVAEARRRLEQFETQSCQ